MKNILTEALVNSATNASFIFSYTNSAKLRLDIAGTSDKDEVATGVMIETIVHFFENECK